MLSYLIKQRKHESVHERPPVVAPTDTRFTTLRADASAVFELMKSECLDGTVPSLGNFPPHWTVPSLGYFPSQRDPPKLG